MARWDSTDGIQINCPDCGCRFSVPHSMGGGMGNCPECRRAVEIPGADWLFRTILIISVLAICGLSALLGVTVSTVAGVVALVMGLLILSLIVAVM